VSPRHALRRYRLYLAGVGLLASVGVLLTLHLRHQPASHGAPSPYRVEFAELPAAIQLGSPTRVWLRVFDRASGAPIPDALATKDSLLLVLTSQDLADSRT
jgi:hypothetical protein